MLDGTPILDIKPYLPHAEAIPNCRSGWIQNSNERSTLKYQVVLEPEVALIIKKIEKESPEIIRYVTDILSRDPYPHVYRRIKLQKDGTSEIAVKRWRFYFGIEGTTILIFKITHSNS
jgi:hypothetical protein